MVHRYCNATGAVWLRLPRFDFFDFHFYQTEKPAVFSQWWTPGRTVLQFTNFGSPVIGAAPGKRPLRIPRSSRYSDECCGGPETGVTSSAARFLPERRVVSDREIRQPFFP
jgi:hypothetical protein